MDNDLRKLRKAVNLTFNNVSREVMNEIELFFYTLKATTQDTEKNEMLDEALKRLRNRIFDIGGTEKNRLRRYLGDWEVRQKNKSLDWIEFGDRLEEKGRRGKDGNR